MSFGAHPWRIVQRGLQLDELGVSETIFALSNGHIGLRGNLDEGEPAHTQGSYLAGFYERHPLPYAESAYGYPEAGETLVNVTNGKLIRLLVDDEPFDLRYGECARHERELDLRDGVLRRRVRWVSPAGRSVEVQSARLVSFSQRAVAAICYEVKPTAGSARIVLQSELVANEPLGYDGVARTDRASATGHELGDPRAAAALLRPLVAEYQGSRELRAELVHATANSGLRMAAGMDHLLSCPAKTTTTTECEEDLARVTIAAELKRGQTLRLVKLLAYGWSTRRSRAALRDQVIGALAEARTSGWEGLCAQQRQYLDAFWAHADVEIDGDAALAQAVRFCLFQVLQASARAEQRAIPAKGLTGSGYDGHTFWDAESYTLPVLSYTLPAAARHALGWRHSTLPQARERARTLNLAGATFPWRTISGRECSGYWPASTAAFHINADIAEAVRRYVEVTDDRAFMSGAGLELLVETARLWRSLGHHDSSGAFRIDGVTGPDEYTALVDNNVYTNLMAARNLRSAADAAARHHRRAAELSVNAEEIAAWREAADSIYVPRDEELGVTPACEGFTRLRQWDFEGTAPDQYPLLLHFHNYLLYSSQVVKQADLVMALYACGDRFSAEQKRVDFDFYEPITVRDSSLSAAIQAIVAAEVGHLNLALELLTETALMDLADLAANSEQGIHLAACAGAWLAVAAGFGGLRDHGGPLCFAPALPSRLRRVSFGVLYRGAKLRVSFDHDHATYELEADQPVEIVHHGERVELSPGAARKLALPRPGRRRAPRQPTGRRSAQRHPRS
jgi:alpha,alpha-trehalose phosphorylase